MSEEPYVASSHMLTKFLEDENKESKGITNLKDKEDFDAGRNERMLMLFYNDKHPPILKISNGTVFILVSHSTINFTARLISLVQKYSGRELNEIEYETIRQVAILITTNLRWDTVVHLDTPDMDNSNRLRELDTQKGWNMDPEPHKKIEEYKDRINPDDVEPEVTF